MYPFHSLRLFAVTVLSVLFLLPASCVKEEGVADSGRVRVDFRLDSGPSTRSAVSGYEDVVGSLDVLVFRSGDGMLDGYSRVSGTGVSSVSAELSGGTELRWHVVANAPQGSLSGYVSETDFLNGLTTLERTASSSLFVMHGAGAITDAGKLAEPVRVWLDRYSCKVSVGTVDVKWKESLPSGSVVSLGRIALVNVVGTTPLSGVPAAGSLWYNRMDVDGSLSGALSSLLVADFSSVPLDGAGTADIDCSLYCMPNPTDNGVDSSNAPQWSPRNTRIAVEIIVDGMANWYPVDIPAMECNRHYVIDRMIVLGPGSDSPDKPVVRSEMEFSFTVVPWGETDIPVSFD